MIDFQSYAQKYRTELLQSCVPFWLYYGPDERCGGIRTCLDRYGNVYSEDKSVWMQGRAAYMFSHLCNVYGANAEYSRMAASCIQFLNDHCIDKADGRMYFTVTGDGRPLRKRRYFFSEIFYIMANAEYYRMCGDQNALRAARDYFGFVCDIHSDPKKDPYKITPKYIAETRATRSLSEPMMLLNTSLLLYECDEERRQSYEQKIRLFAEEILHYFYKKEKHAMFETVGMNGEYDGSIADYRVINPGHCMEASWFLSDAGAVLNDEEIAACGRAIFEDAFRAGWDTRYGGIFYFVDYEKKPVFAYEHDMKLWWPHNEGVLASLKLHERTGDAALLECFRMIDEYAFSHFSDAPYGEWFGYLRRDGQPTEPPCKGHIYKGPFHVLRMLCEGEQVLKRLQNKEGKK